MKKYTNDLDEIKTLDIACSGGDWYINKHISKDSDYYMDIDQNGEREWVNSNLDKGESLLIWSFEENRRIRPIGERNNISFTKDCVKINPNHNLVNDDHVSLGIDYVDKELFKRVTDDMQPEKIIVPIFNSSDERLKENVSLLSVKEARKILRLKPVKFTWKKTRRKSWGLIAQEVEKVIPEGVITTKEGKKSIDYETVIAGLLKIVQHLYACWLKEGQKSPCQYDEQHSPCLRQLHVFHLA
jgi:hypothetical protein